MPHVRSPHTHLRVARRDMVVVCRTSCVGVEKGWKREERASRWEAQKKREMVCEQRKAFMFVRRPPSIFQAEGKKRHRPSANNEKKKTPELTNHVLITTTMKI